MIQISPVSNVTVNHGDSRRADAIYQLNDCCNDFDPYLHFRGTVTFIRELLIDGSLGFVRTDEMAELGFRKESADGSKRLSCDSDDITLLARRMAGIHCFSLENEAGKVDSVRQFDLFRWQTTCAMTTARFGGSACKITQKTTAHLQSSPIPNTRCTFTCSPTSCLTDESGGTETNSEFGMMGKGFVLIDIGYNFIVTKNSSD